MKPVPILSIYAAVGLDHVLRDMRVLPNNTVLKLNLRAVQ